MVGSRVYSMRGLSCVRSYSSILGLVAMMNDVSGAPLSRTIKRYARPCLLVGLLLACVSLVAWLAHWQYRRHNFKRFDVVRDGVLYRSGQLSEYGMRRVVEEHGIRTVIALRQDPVHLNSGVLFDLCASSGAAEADLVENTLGAAHIHWDLGSEVYYPWMRPQHYRQFFDLVDSNTDQPILVHCVAGRHRTGVFVALFRIEYDCWDSDEAIQEMQSWDFGPVPRVLDHNLRTYVRRPRPTEKQLQNLRMAFRDSGIQRYSHDYESLLHELKDSRGHERVEAALLDYLNSDTQFGLCLARRLLEEPDDPVAPVACALASQYLNREHAAPRCWTAAASLIADLGSREAKEHLLAFLADEDSQRSDDLRYEMVVRGLTDRFDSSRFPFLRPLLKNARSRQMPGAEKYRYCDTAVAYVTSVLNVNFMVDKRGPKRKQWDRGAAAVEKWYLKREELS